MAIYRHRNDPDETPQARLARIVDSFSEGYSESAVRDQLIEIEQRLMLVQRSQLTLIPLTFEAEYFLTETYAALDRFVHADLPWLLHIFAERLGVDHWSGDDDSALAELGARLSEMDEGLSLIQYFSFVANWRGETTVPTIALQQLLEEDYTWLCMAIAHEQDVPLELLEMEVLMDYERRNG